MLQGAGWAHTLDTSHDVIFTLPPITTPLSLVQIFFPVTNDLSFTQKEYGISLHPQISIASGTHPPYPIDTGAHFFRSKAAVAGNCRAPSHSWIQLKM
jgi:hypothetical protein